MKTLLGLIFIVIFVTHLTSLTSRLNPKLDGLVKLKCEPSKTGFGNISCVLQNASKEDIVFLKSPFMLEGPLGSDEYIYKYTAGERFENIIEYGFPGVKKLGGPILFKPAVHLTDDDLKSFHLLPANSEVFFTIDLNNIRDNYLSKSSTWLVRIKVIVAPTNELRKLIDSGKLSNEDCSKKLLRAIPAQAIKPPELLTACPPQSGTRYKIDECFDIISESFEHVFSNEFILPVKRKIGDGG